MTTQSHRDLETIKSRISSLEAALANGDKIVRYADGTYVEFSSFDDLSQRLRYFQSKLAEQEDAPRRTAYTVRIDRGIN